MYLTREILKAQECMRITLRTSGGRGEFEVAGTHGSVATSDLFDKHFLVEVVPGVRIATDLYLRLKDGKRRMRLPEGSAERDRHIHALMAAVLILPKPIRQLSETGFGKLQLVNERFAVADVEFDIVNMGVDIIVIRPTFLRLANCDHNETLDVIERMKIIFSLWNAVDLETSTTEFSYFIKAHRAAFFNGNAKEIISVVTKLRKVTDPDEDPLNQLIQVYGLKSSDTYNMGLEGSVTYFSDENSATLSESTQEAIKKWKRVADRGAAGEAFKKEVNQVYNYTCLFTGNHLPRVPPISSPGVDAAHILPWAAHNINSIQNGICLNKLCHWAFDEGILRMDFDAKAREYILSVPAIIKIKHPKIIELSPFLQLEGIIPKERLPENQNLWPSPDFISRFNDSFK